MNSASPPSSAPIGLPPEQFAAAFPFHLALDRSMKLLQAGSTLRRICPDVQPGANLDQIFRVIRPEGRMTLEWVREHSLRFFLLEHLTTKLQLRGEFVFLTGEETLLFLGSPWFTDAAEIASFGLGFEDFAIHDSVVDLLQVFQASKLALADAKKLAAKLTTQRAELRAANDRLRQQEAETRKLALIAARTDNAVVLTDAAGLTVWVNEGFTRTAGYTLEDALGKTPGSVLQGPGTDPATVQRIRECLRKGEGFSEEILNYRKDGSSYWLAIEAQPIHDDQGRLINFMAIQRDVTERKRIAGELVKAKEAAEAANLAKSEFLATISHELRTPLTSIRGFLQTVIADQDMPVPSRQEFLTVIHDQSLRLSRLVDNILDLSSLESGRTQFNDEPVNLRQLAQTCVTEIAPLTGMKAQRIESHLAADLPVFRGDPIRLQSIFTNLLSNAVKFTPAGGSICVRLDLFQGAIRIAVEDTGPGIPADQRELIFEKFHRVYRCGASTAGTGLGLPIVKAIVEHYGGRIEVESQVNHGSCFRIYLPLNPVRSPKPHC